MSRKRILVIDDEEPITLAVKVLLQDDYDVATSTCPLRGIEFFSRNRVDLVILDMKMPRMNGIEAFDEIRRIRPDVSVIFLTAHLSGTAMEEIRARGAKGVLAKPFDVKELKSSVDYLLSGD